MNETCNVCGTPLVNGVCPNCSNAQAQYQQQNVQYQQPDSQNQQTYPQYQQPDAQYQQAYPQYQQPDAQYQQAYPQYQQPDAQYQQAYPQYQQPDAQYQQTYSQNQQSDARYQQPYQQYEQLAPQYEQPVPQYEQSAHQYEQPAPQYEQPFPQYEQSAPQYEQSVPQYEQPIPQYEQPAPQYEQPAPQYEQPASKHEQPVPPFRETEYDEPETDSGDNKRIKKLFMNPNEKFICALGNNYLQSFLAGGFVSKAFAVVSDKRVYFRGKSLEKGEKALRFNRVTSMVDLKDVTGTETRTVKNIGYLVKAYVLFGIALVSGLFHFMVWNSPDLLFVLMWIALGFGLLFLLLYFIKKKTLLTIVFGGGGIMFPINWFPASEGENFQKKLRIAKDDVVERTEKIAADTLREITALKDAISRSEISERDDALVSDEDDDPEKKETLQ